MTTLAEQLERIQWLLQDRDTSQGQVGRLTTQYQEMVAHLARKHVFPSILWRQAITNQSRYTLPANTAKIAFVFYNERVLRYVTEASLDRTRKNWEALHRDPDYWTTDNQAPNVIRLVPTPLRTGSDVPVIPSPLVMDMRDNLVVFFDEDPSQTITAPDATIPVMQDWEDVLVFRTVEGFAEQESPTQNLPLAQLCGQLAGLWEDLLMKK